MDDNKKGINYGNMVGYDQKADIWSLGTLCYEMLIGCSAFNSKTMQELVQKVESGNYQIPTHLSKEVISFLNAMLQYNGQKRLSANELARHHFLTKNVKDFSSIDLRKVSNKINRNNNLNVNIKRNNTIWSIFNEEDEKKLINIPCNYLLPITEEDEYNQSLTGNYINYNNNYVKYPQDNIKQKNINNNVINNNNYQGYGAGYNGVEPYDISYTSGNYQAQLNNQVQVQYGDPFSGPVINVVEQETNTPFIFRGVKKGPIAELPSFGVPSPGEENNTETGYTFSSAVFQPDSKPDAKTDEI
jgi:serine/threonine protein kinase